MNEKIAKIKKKIKENSEAITVVVVASLTVTTAYIIHKANQALEESNQELREANADLEWSMQKLQVLDGAIKHVQATGHTTTIHDEEGRPLFDVSMPKED